MPGRLFALGDIHGCSLALDAVLGAAALGNDDTLVTLGDYVDRGPDSRGVLDRLIELQGRCRLVPLLGNHDLMFLDALDASEQPPGLLRGAAPEPGLQMWLGCGGVQTIESYGAIGAVPEPHRDFLRRLRLSYEADRFVFFHANYDPETPIAEQAEDLVLWTSLRDYLPPPIASGRTAVVGHTAQKDGEILELDHLICIDTYCYGGGWLTLLDLRARTAWQADARGRLRS